MRLFLLFYTSLAKIFILSILLLHSKQGLLESHPKSESQKKSDLHGIFVQCRIRKQEICASGLKCHSYGDIEEIECNSRLIRRSEGSIGL
jgi:hypothetical protein